MLPRLWLLVGSDQGTKGQTMSVIELSWTAKNKDCIFASSSANKKRHHECNEDSFNYLMAVMTFWMTPWYTFISWQTIMKYVWTNRCTTQILLWIICCPRWNIQISLENIFGLSWNTLIHLDLYLANYLLLVSQPCGRWRGWMVQPLHGLLPFISSASPCSFLGKHIWILIQYQETYSAKEEIFKERKYNCMIYFL